MVCVGRVLGRGALSCVFRGRVGLLRTAVAIKQLDKEDKESAKAFCRELMIASSLHSPNIVPLVGFCIDPEEGLFLVYKYVSGGSLERHLHGTNHLLDFSYVLLNFLNLKLTSFTDSGYVFLQGGRKVGRVVQHSLGLLGTRLQLGLQKLWLICIMELKDVLFIETLSPLTFFFLLRRLRR